MASSVQHKIKTVLVLSLLLGAVVAEEECLCEISAGRAAVCGGAAVIAAPYAIAAAGFTAAGVLAGSAAAFVQSIFGNIAAGSLFAGLQSAGAAGLGAGTLTSIAGAAGAACGITRSKECCKNGRK